MHESPSKKGEFSLLIEVPPGQHRYKFIVDEEWRFAPDQSTETDPEGRINNIIQVKARREDGSETDNGDKEDSVRYEQIIPSFEDYTNDPPTLPPHLGFSLLNVNEDINRGTPDSHLDPLHLIHPQHVTLNHLYVSTKRSLSEKDEVLVLGMTQRYMNKFVTTVLYKPSSDRPSHKI